MIHFDHRKLTLIKSSLILVFRNTSYDHLIIFHLSLWWIEKLGVGFQVSLVTLKGHGKFLFSFIEEDQFRLSEWTFFKFSLLEFKNITFLNNLNMFNQLKAQMSRLDIIKTICLRESCHLCRLGVKSRMM